MSELQQCRASDCDAYFDDGGSPYCPLHREKSLPSMQSRRAAEQESSHFKSNCICGARGIDLDSHKCVLSLEARIDELRNEHLETVRRNVELGSALVEELGKSTKLRAENERLKTACGGAEQFLGCITWNEDWTEVEGSDILQQLRNAIGDTK